MSVLTSRTFLGAAIACVIGLISLANIAAYAAPAIPNGWKARASNGEYVYGVEDGIIAVTPVPVEVLEDPRKFAKLIEAQSCEGLGTAPMLEYNGQTWFQAVGKTGMQCSAFFIQGTGQAYIVMAIEKRGSKSDSTNFAKAIVLDKLGLSGLANRDIISGSSTTNEATLKAAIAAVPLVNRPIAMVTRQEAQSSGGYVYYVYKPWMIFANGWASDSSCYNWDPRYFAPTPASLGTADKKCDLVKWRKVGTEYDFQDKDGSWDDAGKGAKLYSFTPGQRLDATLENISGAGTAPVTGMISVNTIWSGTLRMTKSGLIQSDWANQTGISGGGFGGGASGSGAKLSGQYYIDGYLIAVGDKQGRISVGFIAGSNDKGQPRFTFIYLNGDLYWPGDKK
jgi:hypothetical protein